MRLPRRRRALTFIRSQEASLTVAVFGDRDWRFVNRCLSSLHTLGTDNAPDVLVFHGPAIAGAMRMHAGVQLVPTLQGSSFTNALKEAASRSRGSYLYVVDSRIVAPAGAIVALMKTLQNDATIGAASSKICTPGGRLREAGRTILSDGTIQPCGAGCPATDSRFGFLREIESVSPASFMVRLDLLRAVLQDAPVFSSATYAIGHLCLELRARGMRCVCQPLSTVYREREAREAVDPNDLRDFRPKWLRSGRISRIEKAGAILVLDEHVPFEDRDAGSRRLAALLRLARTSRWSVVFGSLDARAYAPYCEQLRQSGIEVILGFKKGTLARLIARGSRFDCVWLSRPRIASDFIEAVRGAQPSAAIVYDTVDLHHLRLARQSAVQMQSTGSEDMEQLELEAARSSDIVVVTSAHEAEVLRAKGIDHVEVVGLTESAPSHVPDANGRTGILFVGNYVHEPNVDAAMWLVTEIMPLVRQRIPGLAVTLAGADPTPALKKLSNEWVRVPGFVNDLDEMLGAHRVFAAPLRFGAGLKGKIVRAMAAGIPIVTTSIGAEGILSDENEMVVADDAETFAAALVTLYEDKTKWLTYSAGARRGARRFTPEILAGQLHAVLDGAKRPGSR